MAYTKTGPFTNGGAPGISKAFLDSMETFLVLVNSMATDPLITSNGAGIGAMPWLNLNPTAIVVNGATAGTMTLYQPLRGTLKLVVVFFNGFRNGAGPAQTITLPTAFAGRSKAWSGDMTAARTQFLLSGSAQNIAVITTLALSGGTDGAVTIFTGMPGRCNGEILTGWDTLSVPSGDAGTTTGILLIIGI